MTESGCESQEVQIEKVTELPRVVDDSVSTGTVLAAVNKVGSEHRNPFASVRAIFCRRVLVDGNLA